MDVLNVSHDVPSAAGVTITTDPQDFGLRHIIITALVTVAAIAYIKSVVDSIKSPLSSLPGPWYANFTTLHLRWFFAQGTIWKYAQKNHEKLGPIVRLGPRQIWVSDKQAMRDILVTTDLPKVSMYAEISRDRSSPGLFGEMFVLS